MKNVDVLIVGGGVAGIASALTAQQYGASYCLVEASAELGGLLKSISYQNHSFDYGTHFINFTYDKNVDALLMPSDIEKNWHQFSYLKAGSYYSVLNENSPLICAKNVLSEEEYAKGVVELLDGVGKKKNWHSLADQLEQSFGNVFAKNIFIPAIEKLFFKAAGELIPDAHLRYGLHRIIISTPESSMEMKKSEALDALVAHHYSSHTSSAIKHIYPKKGGVGGWIKSLTEKLDFNNIEVNKKVLAIKKIDGEYCITLSDSDVVKARHIIWSLPQVSFFKCLGEEVSASPPNFLNTELIHFVFDSPFLTSLFYVTNYDPKHSFFRVTLYSNVQGAEDGYRATVEILKNDLSKSSAEKILSELIEASIVSSNAKVIFSVHEMLLRTFPVMDDLYSSSLGMFSDRVDDHPCVSFVGRSGGGNFFMTDVLVDCYRQVSDIFTR